MSHAVAAAATAIVSAAPTASSATSAIGGAAASTAGTPSARLNGGGDDDAAAGGAAEANRHALSAEEVEQITQTYEAAVGVLADEDARLAQVTSLLPLLRLGIGVHHSGLLPVLRELVELLFAEDFQPELTAIRNYIGGQNALITKS